MSWRGIAALVAAPLGQGNSITYRLTSWLLFSISAMGLKIRRQTLLAFAISSAFGGLAGALQSPVVLMVFSPSGLIGLGQRTWLAFRPRHQERRDMKKGFQLCPPPSFPSAISASSSAASRP